MVDKRIMKLTHDFCLERLESSGYHRLVLVGSRARGTHRPDSDHDFVAVVDDDAPTDVLIGRNELLLDDFRQYYKSHGIAKIDLLISNKSRTEILNPDKSDLIPYACQNCGVVVWENCNK
jgi:predicted nucleotidyltransferase